MARKSLSGHEPIRGEIFGLEHLELHARRIASELRVAAGKPRGPDVPRQFRAIGRELEDAHRRIVTLARREANITVVAEWLLDNFHVVVESLREIRQDLPRGYYRALPK